MKYFLSLLFFLPLCALAHEATIKGTVSSSNTRKALDSMVVVLKNTSYRTVTDTAGHFEFKNIPARDYTIVIEQPGFFKLEKDVDLAADQVLKVDLYVYPEMIDLPEVAASGKKITTASSSEIINSVDLELRPRSTAQDMLRIVPGLFIAQHAGGGKAEQIFVRGFDCDHGTDIATFVDGVPVNMPSHGHGQGYADLHFLIPEVVQNMEIHKGPFDVRYGDFATGAAVAFNTYDALPRNEAMIEIGSTPTNRALSSSRLLLMANIPTGISRLSSYVAGEYSYTPSYFEKNQQFHRFNIFGKVKATLNTHSNLTLSVASFGGSWDASGQVPERAVDAGLIGRFGSIDPTEGGTTNRTNVNLQFKTTHENSQLLMNLYYVNYGFKLFSNFTFFANDTARGDELEQGDQRNVIGFNTQYARFYELGSINAKTTFGAGIRMDNIENDLWHVQERVRLDPYGVATVHENSMNLYIKQDFDITRWFRMDMALRGDYMIFNVDDHLATDTSHTRIDHINYSGFNYQVLPSYKVNFVFTPMDRLQFFINNGIGYHSNDARSVVQDKGNHVLPIAFSAEVGALYHIGTRAVLSTSLWMLDLTDELVYIGDGGITENSGPSRRLGVDFSARVQILKWLYLDADLNGSRNVATEKFLGKALTIDNHLPLAPTFTSQGGLTAKHKKGFSESLRYRYLAPRAANESGSVEARGYCVVDAVAAYEHAKYKFTVTIQNLLNTKWNEAQFDTESRLRGEEKPIDELNFTPGTPFNIKLGFSYFF